MIAPGVDNILQVMTAALILTSFSIIKIKVAS